MTTDGAKLVAITFKGAYLSTENVLALNSMFAAANADRTSAQEFVLRGLREISPETTLHYV